MKPKYFRIFRLDDKVNRWLSVVPNGVISDKVKFTANKDFAYEVKGEDLLFKCLSDMRKLGYEVSYEVIE